MPYFRLKRPPIEARQFDGTREGALALLVWCRECAMVTLADGAPGLVLFMDRPPEIISATDWIAKVPSDGMTPGVQIRRISNSDMRAFYEECPDAAQ